MMIQWLESEFAARVIPWSCFTTAFFVCIGFFPSVYETIIRLSYDEDQKRATDLGKQRCATDASPGVGQSFLTQECQDYFNIDKLGIAMVKSAVARGAVTTISMAQQLR